MGITVQELVFKARAELTDAVKHLSDFHSKIGEDTKKASGIGLGGIAGFVGGALSVGAATQAFNFVSGSIGHVVDMALQANKGVAQTNAVLASTHGVSGQTAASVNELSRKLMMLDGVDDDVVRSASNMLLTFTNIHGSTFPQATQAALDMSAALGEDATSAAMQLGKALNDPIGGVTALRRVGVQLNDQQDAMIKTMIKHGDVAGAQAVILKELQTEFGGSAKAAGDAQGPLQKLSLMWDDMQKVIGNAVLPILQRAAESVMPLVMSFGEKLPGALQRLSQQFMPAIDAIIRFFAPLVSNRAILQFLGDHFEQIALIAGGVLVGALVAAGVAAWGLAAGVIAATWPFLAIGAAIAAVVGLLVFAYQHWTGFRVVVDAVAKALQTGLQVALKFVGDAMAFLHPYVVQAQAAMGKFGGEIATRVQPIIEHLHEFIKAALPVVLALWNRTWPTMQKVLEAVWNIIAGVVKVAWSIVSGIIKVGLDLLSGNWKGAWNDIKAMLSGVWDGIKQIARGAMDGLIALIKNAVNNARDAMGAVGKGITDALSGLGKKLADLATSAISNMIGAIKNKAGEVAGAFGNLFGGIGSHLPHFAGGGVSAGGFAMVGESGPEVVALPPGAQVFRNGTGPGGSGGSGGAMVIHVHSHNYLDGREVTESVLRHTPAVARLATGRRDW